MCLLLSFSPGFSLGTEATQIVLNRFNGFPAESGASFETVKTVTLS